MTVQEIFNSTAVRSVEEQILDLYHETERKHWCNDENKKAIKSLLEVRRRILNSMFVLDEQNKQLLAEFNEAMKQQLIEMRKRAIDLYNSVYRPDMGSSVEVEGKCFIDDYIFLYCEDGVNSFYINNYDPKIESENEFLYLNEHLDNWNEGLDREMTKDMHLTYAFHNLFSHLDFSIYDLLWVRDFNIEIHVEYNYHTYESDEFGDDLDWGKCDYWD